MHFIDPKADTMDASVDAGAPPSLAPGALLGRYVVQEAIGAGGMGVVYSAHDPELDRRVALKLLRADVFGGVSGRTRLLREAQTMARLSHRNVISVYDVGVQDDGQVFVAMELIDGQTLRQWLAAAKHGWREVRDRFVRAGAGLAAAHSAGIVHRDFKPDNVLLDRTGRVLVTDFGLARLAHDSGTDSGSEGPRPHPSLALTTTGARIGTPAYMSPEQLRGDPADAKSDQFNFCVALYEALYGERPFVAATEPDGLPSLDALALEILQGRIRPAPAGSRVPAAIRRALVRGLAAAPGERHASMNALIHALSARPMSRPALVVAAVVVVAAAAVAVGMMGLRRAPVRPRGPAVLARVTSFVGEERLEAPRISPDGKQVLFRRGQKVYLMDLPRGEPRELVIPSVGRIVSVSDWFPDGKRVLLSLAERPDAAVGLYAVSLADGQHTRLADGDGPGAVSPDGRRVALRNGMRLELVDVEHPGPGRLVHQDVGSAPILTRAAWSPEGDLLAWLSSDGLHVEILDLEGHVRSRLLAPGILGSSQSRVGGLAWLPDHRLVYSNNHDKHARVFAVPIDLHGQAGTGEPVLDVDVDSLEDFSLTRDGARLVVVGRDIQEDTYVAGLTADGLRLEGERSLPARADVGGAVLGWTAEEESLVIAGRHGDVTIQSIDSDQSRVLGRIDVHSYKSLSPDGTSVLYIPVAHDGTAMLMQLPLTGTGADPTALRPLDWAVVNRGLRCIAIGCIVGARNPSQSTFRWLDPANGVGATIVTIPVDGSAQPWSVSPSGRWLATVVAGTQGRGIALVDTSSGQMQRLGESLLPCEVESLTWTRDETALLVEGVALSAERAYHLYRVDRAGGVTDLGGRPSAWFWDLKISPDGRGLAYSGTRIHSDLWTIDGL